MDAYAVVETGGKQYRVKQNDTLQIEKIDAEVGQDIELGRVLAVSDGETLQLGKPELDGAKVMSTVVEHTRGDKVVSFRKNRRKGYARKVGHKQWLTVVKVQSIQ